MDHAKQSAHTTHRGCGIPATAPVHHMYVRAQSARYFFKAVSTSAASDVVGRPISVES